MERPPHRRSDQRASSPRDKGNDEEHDDDEAAVWREPVAGVLPARAETGEIREGEMSRSAWSPAAKIISRPADPPQIAANRNTARKRVPSSWRAPPLWRRRKQPGSKFAGKCHQRQARVNKNTAIAAYAPSERMSHRSAATEDADNAGPKPKRIAKDLHSLRPRCHHIDHAMLRAGGGQLA